MSDKFTGRSVIRLQEHLRFYAWMLSQESGGFHVSLRMIQNEFRIARNAAQTWRSSYFAARGMFPMRPLPRVE